MTAPPDGPPRYEMRHRATWRTYLAGSMFAVGSAVVVGIGIATDRRVLLVVVPFVVGCAVVGVVYHRELNGRLYLRVDERGIEFARSGVFVAWPHVVDVDLGWSGEDRALVFRVVRGSVVPLCEGGERLARHVNRPRGRRGRPDPYTEIANSHPDLLDRAALSAVIRAHAPHVTGRFGTQPARASRRARPDRP